MKKKYSVEEILRILSEEKQTGEAIRGICREHNITEQAYYRWRAQVRRNGFQGSHENEAA